MNSNTNNISANQLKIALAGQANVGKSVIFNYLTKLHQHIGNWPGKTVEKMEGTLFYKGRTIDVVDLPGIYSLTTYSTEEVIAREYIVYQKPDFIINVVDGTNLERNLLLTLQLLELGRPMVLAINFADLFTQKGVSIDYKKLEQLLGIPVAPVEAIYGKGISDVLNKGINISAATRQIKSINYGKEVENEIAKLSAILENIDTPYLSRWLAIKLLEKDAHIEQLVFEKIPDIIAQLKASIAHLEEIHGHDSSIIIAAERCHQVFNILKETITFEKKPKRTFSDKLDAILCNKILGYPILICILALTFSAIFIFGNYAATNLEKLLPPLQHYFTILFGTSAFAQLGFAAIESIFGLIAIVFPYILPFYFILSFLENSGYLARIAFLTDNLMHKLGIHGKACIPLLLGYGCNVPGCLSCRIMETSREKFITAFLVTFVPCSAITVIILGLVGKFIGLGWFFALYLFNLIVIFGLGKILTKTLGGEATELIMEMPDYRLPNFRLMLRHTWFKTKSFFRIAVPLVIIAGVIIQGLYLSGGMNYVVKVLNPITVDWLRLPAVTGVLLIFGIMRKELILIMLATLLQSNNFAAFLTPVQMITLALLSMFYIPCLATIAALKHEFGWSKALGITAFKIAFAIFFCGIIARILPIFFY